MIGLTLGNRYLIEENIGVGGMAVVYRAKDTLLNRYVAVKVLKNEFMNDEEFVKKFAMEAQSAASLSHQNIVSVYDVGSSTIEGVKYNYIVMEYINGKTLKEVIDEQAPLEPDYISNIGVQIASALDAAHKNNVIHRDIKPHNILINEEGVAKVTDFGIARISSSATITYTSTVLGTVHYISPEQAKGKFIDEKSDIYSLGVVLYEMATGKIPFDAENAVGIALKHIQDPLIEPKSLNKQIPDGLNSIIIKAMSKNPADRFKNATELKIALLNYRNFRLDDSGEGQTERIGVIKDEDIEERRNKAIYNMPKDEEEDEEEEKKPGVFKTYILPILLAALLLGGLVLAFNVFFNDNGMVQVPALNEMTYEAAKKTLEEKDLKIKVENEDEIENKENAKVVSQNPAANTEVEKNTEVTVKLEEVNEEVEIPDFKNNWQGTDAKNKLEELGLVVTIEEKSDDNIREGLVIATNPPAGTKVEKKSNVTLYVSKGPEEDKNMVGVPNVVGYTEKDAKNELENLGLTVETTEEYSNKPVGQVIGQSISGREVSKGTTITLTISKGPEETKPTETQPSTSTKVVTIEKNKIQSMVGETYTIVVVLNRNGNPILKETHSLSEGNISVKINGKSGDSYEVFVDDTSYDDGILK
ncbi:Stk1 family PASTA domain-containing Ser/Thr kinase [Miniphocaeibacter massiliensis]|uniref:Stk1 family PASTA domain-containing Ser/Thr kinase n=1 Tax=Miniphocaeibacter massiliensis TaxID=2041841 RepID=UPI000C06DA41|nr:Stk1 family PASTA domain-containing Ser/Thr kinase [Miniphocaeibacter massiliensis]